MGLHTWFYKEKELYLKQQELYSTLDKFEDYEIYLDDLEVDQINHEIDEISKINDSDHHDIFRTNKREANGEYTYDVIFSKQECEKWLIDNNIVIEPSNKRALDNFWEEFPNGVIDFG